MRVRWRRGCCGVSRAESSGGPSEQCRRVIGAFAFHGGVDGDLDRAVAEVGGVGEGGSEANFGDREYRRG
jgi:hypothetical protein